MVKTACFAASLVEAAFASADRLPVSLVYVIDVLGIAIHDLHIVARCVALSLQCLGFDCSIHGQLDVLLLLKSHRFDCLVVVKQLLPSYGP